ncbi:OprO/OprP family phosphate-selective porin [Endozoicomonas lisbonensis]|uniref:Phosphate-selective porin OprO/OprP n=1 Tax=Endozoicomonas lisbonensis TaxID=3120522 RepID=A0ABV2SDQ9_9GAMM
MKLKAISMAVAAVTAGFVLSASAGVVKTEGEDIIVSTSNGGLQLKTESGDFSFKVSGKLQWDYADYSDLMVDAAKTQDKGRSGYIRRGEVAFSGKAYDSWKYKLKLTSDEGNEKVKLDDAYIDYTGLNPVDVRVGRWDRSFGLEDSTSSSWIMAIERPMIFSALNGGGGNKYGIQLATEGDNYTLSLGLHNNGEVDEENTKQERLASYAVRATFAPVMEDNMLVHVGINYYNANPDKKEDRTISVAPAVKKAAKVDLVNLTSVKSDSEYVLELAGQFQSLQAQAEYAVRDLKSDDANADGKVSGYYGQLSYMLDGGKRSYKGGAFSKPESGQWELFGRYGKIKGEKDGVSEDTEITTYTLGVNYFATKNIRASLNYVNAKLDHKVDADKHDKGSAVVGRLQYVF